MNSEFKDQLEMLKELEKANSPGTIKDFANGVMLTSLAQSIGLSFQATVFHMQSAAMTQQAANVRAVIELYGHGRHPSARCPDSGGEPSGGKSGEPSGGKSGGRPSREHEGPTPSSSSDTRAAARSILEALDEAPVHRSNGGEPR